MILKVIHEMYCRLREGAPLTIKIIPKFPPQTLGKHVCLFKRHLELHPQVLIHLLGLKKLSLQQQVSQLLRFGISISRFSLVNIYIFTLLYIATAI